jgi:hypothetical protein
MTNRTVQDAAAPVASEFPAQAYLRDFRAAGGRSGFIPGDTAGGIFFIDDKDGSRVDREYLPAMQSALDWRDDVKAALAIEATTLSPAKLAILHRY